ncbi:Kiwa anti-phage protein KwaB-like domain-containing protein [Natrinema longum]|uniref:DUF4868 domain-containing protein n=1 Tax=Natrinema longum TaxID=370324 RepID=A0A8A2UDU1_9EURY|nr:Kiwa anti-phage protein KwaB-like domain-containing protein [Natrinema longum]MBZ6496000.1 DUF4868 domain-containing protein [Natrinema longum]QSW86068.1 DUF4868 domain-containing protein [Natrinema longum]
MDVEDAHDHLRKAKDLVNEDPTNYTRQFLLVDKSDNIDGEYEAGEVPLHRNIQIKISKWVLEQLQTELNKLKNESRSLAKYDIENANKKKVPIQYIDTDDVPLFDRFQSIVMGNSFSETTYGEEDDPSFQVFRAINRLHQDRFAAFSVYTKSQIIGHTWKIKAALRGNEYNTFEEDLVALPDTYDVIYYNGVLFIFNPGRFEKMFDYFETYEESASSVFDSLEESDLTIHNLDKVKTTVMNDNISLRKMSVIEKVGVYDSLTLDKAEEIINEYNLNLNIEEDPEDGRGIRVPDLRHRHDLLRLLNDDHLASELTNELYQVYGKDRRSD